MLKRNEQTDLSMEAPAVVDQHKPQGPSPMRAIVQAALMIAVVFAGIMGMNRLTALREDAPSRPPFQTVYTVDSVTVTKGRYQPSLLVYGEIQAAQSVELRSLVAGQVVSVNPGLKVGGRVEKGAELFRVDPFAFESALGTANANLAETSARIEENKARIKIEASRIESLREQLVLAQNDLARISSLRGNGTATAKQVEDREFIVSQRRQSLEQAEFNLVAERSRLQQLEAVSQRYDWAKRQAERDLTDTTLFAPLSGIVSQKNIATGRLINANDVVVSMYDEAQLEVRFTLTDERFGRIQSDDVGIVGREVEVVWTVGGEEFRYPAKIDRIGAQITSSRGGVEVIAVLDADTNAALRPGAFVEVIVPDKAFTQHFRVPETSVFGNDTVYAIEEGELVARDIRLYARDGDYVIIAGELADGDEVLITRIAEISEGLKVKPPQDAATGDPATANAQ